VEVIRTGKGNLKPTDVAHKRKVCLSYPCTADRANGPASAGRGTDPPAWTSRGCPRTWWLVSVHRDDSVVGPLTRGRSPGRLPRPVRVRRAYASRAPCVRIACAVRTHRVRTAYPIHPQPSPRTGSDHSQRRPPFR